MIDLSIKNALVITGEGKPPFKTNIAIKDGKIIEIGDSQYQSEKTIDAEGLVACPGFIDMHSHSDLRVMRQPAPQEKIRQGITTELLGQDGLGVAPLKKKDAKTMATLVSGLNGQIEEDEWTWNSFSEYLDALEQHPLPSNVAVLASHGPTRIQVMGMSDRQPDSTELEKLKSVVETAFQEGAFGFSTGLIYPPCSFAQFDELVTINEVAAKYGLPFVVHQRDEGYLIRQSFSELLNISQKTGSHLHVSHLQAYGQVNWPLMNEIIRMAEKHIASGGEISWDRYPYVAGCTVLSAVLPPWTFALGTEALIKNLMDSTFRQRIHDDFKKDLEVWNNRSISVGWEKIFVTAVQSEKYRWMEGKHCAELAKMTNKDPVDFVCDLLAEEKLAVTMVSFYGCDEIMEKVISHPMATIGTDGIFGGKPHPRLFGSYAKYFRHFVNEKELLTLPEAIRKVTSYPAKILGINDRGMIKEGYWADIVLLAPEKIKDCATYENPEQYSEGIEFVLVNGKIAVNNGIFTGEAAGKVLRK